MSDASGASMPGSDAELLNTIRSGDPAPFNLLRARHGAAARYLAGQLLSGPAQADAAVEMAFTRVLDAIRRGGGPSDAFRPYLLTAVRRAAREDAASAAVPVDEQQIPDPGQLLADTVPPGQDSSLVLRAFVSLPERWQAVLWHADIEGATPAETAPLLGLTATGVLDLAGRARDGLSRAYLQLQQNAGEQEPAPLPGPGAALRESVAPAVLGEAAAAYLAGLTEAGVAGAVRPARLGRPARLSRSSRSGSAGSGAHRAAATGPGAGPAAAAASQDRPQRPRRHQRAVAAGVVAVLAMFAIGGYVLSRSSGDGGTPAASGQAADTTSAPPPAQTASPAPQLSSTSHAPRSGASGAPGKLPPTSATPIAATPPGATSSAPPRRSRTGPRRPHAQVTTQVSVFAPRGNSNVAAVVFSIADAGPAATDHLTAYVSLPPDARMANGHRWGGNRSGWSCAARNGGVSCAHAAIAASDRTDAIIAVQVTGSRACGQPVQVTVTGGASTASAQSAQTIQCRSHHHGWSQQDDASSTAAQQGALRLTADPRADQRWPGRGWPGSSGWAGHRRDGQPYGLRWPWTF